MKNSVRTVRLAFWTKFTDFSKEEERVLWEWWDTLAGSTKATGGPHTVRVTRVTYL
jgi:hypothetical protein